MAIKNNPFCGSIDMLMVKKYIEKAAKSIVVDNKATKLKTKLTKSKRKN